MASSSSVKKIPVFINTNLQTHLAMAVHPEITVAQLKREFEMEHSICFPDVGEIRVIALMVKRKSCFYRLQSSMTIKNVFQGRDGVWFLFIDAKLVSNSVNSCLSNGLVGELGVSDCNITESHKAENRVETEKERKKMKRKESVELEGLMQELLTPVYVAKKKKKRRVKEKKTFNDKVVSEGKDNTAEKVSGVSSSLGKRNFCSFGNNAESDHQEEHISQLIVETPTVSSSERVSVTGIITRYFPDSDEGKKSIGSRSDGAICDKFGACKCKKRHIGKSSRTKKTEHSKEVVVRTTPQTTKTPPRRLLPLSVPAEESTDETSRKKYGRLEVGNRLVVAANDLKISITSNNKLANVICKSKAGKVSDSLVRNIVFDVSESDN